MLIFTFILLFLALIALALGVAVLILSKVHENTGTVLARVIGYIIMIAATLGALCSSYYAVKYCADSYLDKPFPSMMMQDQKMMSGGHQMINSNRMSGNR